MVLKISIIVCTFNPVETILKRVLDAIKNLSIPEKTQMECILVDNNSNPPIIKYDYVLNFLESHKWAKTIKEPMQGLTFARLAGFNMCKSDVVIFMDDDNIPDSSYLIEVKSLIENFNCVGAWGPGKVSVAFINPVSQAIESCKGIFQQKDKLFLQYGCVRDWADYYPAGLGLIVKRKIMELYQEEILNGKLSATDRTDNNLSSGGDGQIIWTGVKHGFAAGQSPKLKITHLISEKKANLVYIKKLLFAVNSSGIAMQAEAFPEKVLYYLKKIPKRRALIFTILYFYFNFFFRAKYKDFQIHLANYLGEISGFFLATSKKNPRWLEFLVQFYKLK